MEFERFFDDKDNGHHRQIQAFSEGSEGGRRRGAVKGLLHATSMLCHISVCIADDMYCAVHASPW